MVKTLMTVTNNNEGGQRSPRLRKLTALAASAMTACGMLSGLGASDAAAEPQKQMHVLELFTSQGCSSCPPADAVLKGLAKRNDVLALSFPVSYWDYLGWKDTLAKDEYNKRQKAYAKQRGDREIYTPQLIVNGMTHVVGSRPEAIDAAMKSTTEKLKNTHVPVSVTVADGKATVTAGAAPEGSTRRDGQLSVICFSKSVTVTIGRGENSGREITYTNVAREIIPAGRWRGENTQYTVDLPPSRFYDGVAALLQENESAAMLGASAVAIPR